MSERITSERLAELTMRRGEVCACTCYFRDITIALVELQERRAAERWIPVSERLPEAQRDVLMVDRDGDMFVYFYRREYFDEHEIITHWQPLPTLPEVPNE